MDRRFEFPYLRDARASDATDPREIEANVFPAELLMPRAMLLRDLGERQLDWESDEIVGELAGRYRVSRHAMTVRLLSLSQQALREK